MTSWSGRASLLRPRLGVRVSRGLPTGRRKSSTAKHWMLATYATNSHSCSPSMTYRVKHFTLMLNKQSSYFSFVSGAR